MDLSSSSSSLCGTNLNEAVVAKRSKIMTTLPKVRRQFGCRVSHSTPANIACVVRNSQTFGRPPRRLYEIPLPFIKHYEEGEKSRIAEMPTWLMELYKHLHKDNIDLQNLDLCKALEAILDTFFKPQVGCVEFFLAGGGVELIADLLIKPYYNNHEDIFTNTAVKTIPNGDLTAVKFMMQILFQCAQTLPIQLSHLLCRPHLVHLLFSLHAEKTNRTFTDATLLLEQMILTNTEKPDIQVDMHEIACLPSLLNSDLNHHQESHLYHVIATLISSSEAAPPSVVTLQDHDKWLMKSTRVYKRNQEFLMSLEPFVKKLFALACNTKLYDVSMVQDVVSQLSQDERSFIYSRILEESPDNPLYQAYLYHEKSIRADAFLLLSLLLTGKCKQMMQKKVLEHNLVQRLEQIVDKIVWKNLDDEVFQDHLHGDYSEHGVGTTVKIQYLRLIYSISDHDIQRYLVLNKKELGDIEQISANYKIPLCARFSTLDRSKCCVKEKGLLVQILDKMKLESGSSYVRFWMTRAIEAFLRGSTCRVNQVFLIENNLVEHLFHVLLFDNRTSQEVIQGHFDLLALLMKNCVHGFVRFSRVVDCLDTFQKLSRIIDENLVDSNMFVRCVVLTLHHFNTSDEDHKETIKNCRILELYSAFATRSRAIIQLISTLTVGSLCQENVSCLNTSIIILMIAKLNDQLPKYLFAILNSQEPDQDVCGKKILEQLRSLLTFWLEHYTMTFKEDDLRSLEESTGFEFSQWEELVKELINPDVTSPNSIMHYLSPLTSQFKLQPKVAPTCIRTS